ncbi:MAG TPA: hypothetical protein VHP83_21055 [Aggregatilineaceae bacterium]|nr:hypothetical protein [Aggregatilineaceae bacterium]
MPDQPLVDDLKRLLDTYLQRSRATGTLIAQLKSSNSTINKTNRALNDYMNQNTNLDGLLLEQAQQAFDRLHFREGISDLLMPDLRKEAKALTVQIGALKEAVAALQGDMIDVIRLDHACQTFQNTPLQDADLNSLMPALNQVLEQAQTRLGSEFGAALRDAMAEMGIEVGGRPPRFEVGRFEIVADFINRFASISYGKILVVPKVKLSLDVLIRTCQSETRTIEGRSEDSHRWIEQFYQAWELARRKNERSTARVNIVECYYELVLLRQNRTFNNAPSKRSFVDYSRAQFIYDFDEFTRRQRLVYQGQVVHAHGATRTQAESTSKSMWIVEGNSPHLGRYVSDVEFVKG